MAEYRRAEIVSGLFIVASVVVFALFAFKVKGTPIYLLEDQGVECEADFAELGELDSAAPVKVGGRRVGTVTGIDGVDATITSADVADERTRRDELPAGWKEGFERPLSRVRFKITDSTLRLAADASASVVQAGFIGQWYVALDPGAWDPANRPRTMKERKDEGVIRLRAVRTEPLIPSVKPIVARVEAILARIEQDLLKPLLEGKSDQLARLIPDLEIAAAEAGKSIQDLRRLLNPKEADSPILRANKLLDDVDAAVVDLKTQISRDLLPPLKLAIEDGQAALTAAKRSLEEAGKLLDDARPQVKDLLENLRSESAKLDSRLTEIQKKLATLLDSADHLASLRQDQVADIMESFRNAAWEIELAARKVRANPAVILFGDEEKQRLEAEPRDDTGLRKSGRAKPYEQRDETPAKKE